MTAPDVTTAVERVRRWVGGDLDCYGTGTEAADKFTTDLRTILSDHARLSAALGEAREALGLAVPLLEVMHSLAPSPEPRKAVWTVITRARTALQQQEARDGRE